MLALQKNPSEYTEKILSFLLYGNENSTRNWMNIYECLFRAVETDVTMLTVRRFRVVVLSMVIATLEMERPAHEIDRQMRQAVIGNVFFKLVHLLTLPQGEALLTTYRSQLRKVLAALLDHFVDIHQSFNPKDDARLFFVLGQLHGDFDIKFLVDVELKKFNRFVQRCYPPADLGAEASGVKGRPSYLLSYQGAVLSSTSVTDKYGLQIDVGVSTVSIVARP